MAGGLLRAWLAALGLWLVAWPFAGAVEQPAQVALALILTGLIFAALGVITGIWADTFDQHAFIANVLITPLALVAGVFYPLERLAEPWHSLTYLDPIFYLVDATRHGYTGLHETPTWVALSLATIAAAGVFALATVLLRRGWRLNHDRRDHAEPRSALERGTSAKRTAAAPARHRERRCRVRRGVAGSTIAARGSTMW